MIVIVEESQGSVQNVKEAAGLWLISRGLIDTDGLSWRTPVFLLLGFLVIFLIPSP